MKTDKTKIKIEKTITYNGCGFPVVVHDVRMRFVKSADDWIFDFDLAKLDRDIAVHLLTSHKKLTGQQIRFIRLFLGLTLREFGEFVGKKHPSVMKWEGAKSKAAAIEDNTDLVLRMKLLYKIAPEEASARVQDFLSTKLVMEKATSKIELKATAAA